MVYNNYLTIASTFVRKKLLGTIWKYKSESNFLNLFYLLTLERGVGGESKREKH